MIRPFTPDIDLAASRMHATGHHDFLISLHPDDIVASFNAFFMKDDGAASCLLMHIFRCEGSTISSDCPVLLASLMCTIGSLALCVCAINFLDLDPRLTQFSLLRLTSTP